MKKREQCRFCGDKLDEVSPMGLCGYCATRELEDTKKYFLRSAIGGTVFFLIVFTVISLIKANYQGLSEFYAGYIVGSAVVSSIANVSARTQIIVYLICFIIPFGRYVKYKASAADNVEFGGDAGSAVVMIELLISLVSGPFCIVLNIYKLIKLSKYTD